MKQSLLFIFAALFLLVNSCASVNMKKASPAEYGYGLWATPGWQIGESNTSIHGLMSYSRLNFDGGHDNLTRYGLQVRQSLAGNNNTGLWIGAEAAIANFTSVFDEESFIIGEPTSSGFALGALAGYRFPVEAVPVSGYIGLGFINFGDFELDGAVIDAAGTGFTARAGLCISVMSLLHEKGR